MQRTQGDSLCREAISPMHQRFDPRTTEILLALPVITPSCRWEIKRSPLTQIVRLIDWPVF